ncbi:uncharacterized protein LOC108160126 [Drosophila miranda]|uniref:Uncharacterized protein n=1 Tax=Drosophila pseudoobscura pseudoobscura TaxID=46245 RepID=A0A6I8V6Z3_DROPS|nr:uncharacterized protein LOC15382880 [Drosophila pseudoobscura]XP_017149409.1 uncharacterized protein LOC108160126 [Drosophila miranda]XP_026841021.1 uncharacterized protein LOC113565053 [Drosophila persimilis]
MASPSPNDLNVTVDVVLPTLIVVAMFVINGFVFHYIMRKRRQWKETGAVESGTPDIEMEHL